MDHESLYSMFSLTESDTSIRVFDLDAFALHANTGREDPISGNLRVVDLNEMPVFTALSYVWGEYSQPNKDIIYCNGCPLEVTQNCLSALFHLRKTCGPITIWIDAICINQHDDREKKCQIPLMRTIYPTAKVVYIWLGEGTDGTDLAMEYLAKGGLPFSRWVRHHATEQVPTGYTMAFRFTFHLLIHVSLLRWRPYYFALEELLSRPWIERLWTLQEVLLAENAVVLCGEKSITWKSMVYAMEYMDYCRTGIFLSPFPPAYHDWRRLITLWLYLKGNLASDASGIEQRTEERSEYMIPRLEQHRKYLRMGHISYLIILSWPSIVLVLLLPVVRARIFSLRFVPSQGYQTAVYVLLTLILLAITFQVLHSLSYLSVYDLHSTSESTSFRSMLPYNESESMMVEIRTRKSFKPEDKYYAIYGLIGRTNILNEPSSQQDLGTVYQALFVDLVRYTKSLEILLFTSRSTLHNCPSWVVDWRAAQQPWDKANYWYKKQKASWANIMRRRTGQGLGLNLRKYPGATLDSTSLWDFQPGGSLKVRGAVISELSWRSSSLEEIDDSSAPETLRKSIAILHAAMSGVEFRKIDIITKDLDLLISFCLGEPGIEEEKDRKSWAKIMYMTQNHPQKALEELKGGNSSVKPWNFHLRMTNFVASHGISLIRCGSQTFSGFGIAAGDSQDGDLIALISGVSMPLVLRRDHDAFKVVGPAFLPGLMDGQVWKSLTQSPICQLGDIVLT